MTKYLVRKCPDCKEVVKIIQVDGKITHTEGVRPYHLYIWRKDHMYSEKTVICTHPNNTGHFDHGPTCNRAMLVSKFKEIKV